jgi:hypothetical protein
VLINTNFKNTGWTPQCFSVSAKPANQIHIKLTSLGDPWDRFVSLIVNDVEIIRAITPFDEVLEQNITIPEPLGGAFSLGNKVCGILTTFVGSWNYFAETTNEITPTEVPFPIFTVDTMDSDHRKLSKKVTPFYAKKGYFYATGHRDEEGASGRRFIIRIDGKTVFDKSLNWGWLPGCGYITPYEFDVNSTVSNIEIESPNCGNCWKISLALTTTPKLPSLIYPLLFLLGFIGVTGVFLIMKKK